MGSDGIPCAPIASHSIPLCTQQFPCLQVPRAVGGHGMAWSLHGRVWEPMGVYGSSWEQSWEQCFLRVLGVVCYGQYSILGAVGPRVTAKNSKCAEVGQCAMLCRAAT